VGVDGTGGVEFGGHDLDPAGFRFPVGGDHEGRAAHIADVGDFFALGQAVRDVEQGALGVAKNQQVGLGVGQHRATHGVRPVVVMGDAAQAGLDRADDHRGAGIGFAAALRVDGDRAVRAFVGCGMGRIGVVGADLAVGGITVDHRIHIAGRNPKIQRGLAQFAERIGRQPVRLADNADAVTLRFQQPSDQRHAEAGMVDVGVAGDQDDVACIPAKRSHFCP